MIGIDDDWNIGNDAHYTMVLLKALVAKLDDTMN